MRHALLPAVAAALFASTSLVYAAPPGFYFEEGTVQSIDGSVLALDSGESFVLPDGWNGDVAASDRVRVYYNMRGGEQVATEIVERTEQTN